MRRLVVGITLVWLLGGALPVGAEERLSTGVEGVPHPLSSEDQPGVREEVARLQTLKHQDPRAFRRAIDQRRTQLHKRLTRLRRRNPQAFEQIAQRMQQHRQVELEDARENNPERFRELMTQQRAAIQTRLQRLQERQPQRYSQLMQRQAVSRHHRLDRLKQSQPEAYEQFVATHPDWVQSSPEQLISPTPEKPGHRLNHE